jgi:translation initiation factor IF-3
MFLSLGVTQEKECKISSKAQRVNEEIQARQVRVIDENGEQVGVISLREALELAYSRDLDLVEVAPNAEPPVCRILNAGKFFYERTKKEREARKAQKTVEVKEIRLSPKIGGHDIDYKLKDARRFLLSGAKVKVRVRFRGREASHPELGLDMLRKVSELLNDVSAVEQTPQVDGRSLLMVLTPAKKS